MAREPLQSADALLVIAFMGGRDVYQELQAIVSGVCIDHHPILLRQVKNPASIADAHAVFVGRGAERHLDKLAELAQQRSLLVITENDDGLIDGSTINLKLMDGRMSFAVSLVAAENADLRLSSRLLALAHQVERP